MVLVGEIALAIAESISANIIYETTKQNKSKKNISRLAEDIYEEGIAVFIKNMKMKHI